MLFETDQVSDQMKPNSCGRIGIANQLIVKEAQVLVNFIAKVTIVQGGTRQHSTLNTPSHVMNLSHTPEQLILGDMVHVWPRNIHIWANPLKYHDKVI